jgi:hypothetical protein
MQEGFGYRDCIQNGGHAVPKDKLIVERITKAVGVLLEKAESAKAFEMELGKQQLCTYPEGYAYPFPSVVTELKYASLSLSCARGKSNE